MRKVDQVLRRTTKAEILVKSCINHKHVCIYELQCRIVTLTHIFSARYIVFFRDHVGTKLQPLVYIALQPSDYMCSFPLAPPGFPRPVTFWSVVTWYVFTE